MDGLSTVKSVKISPSPYTVCLKTQSILDQLDQITRPSCLPSISSYHYVSKSQQNRKADHLAKAELTSLGVAMGLAKLG